MKAIVVRTTGGPEVLQPADLADPIPGDGQVLVEVAAAGVNFIDTYQRSGLYPQPMPFVLGMEGAGTVTALGPGAAGLAIGDHVAWTDVLGSYAQRAVLPADRTVPIPVGVDLETAAACMLQGLTAHYLTHDTFPLRPGQRCLVHAGAGGVGLLLIQLAKSRGAEVFTTVGSPAKADLVRSAGADHVILYRNEDFGAAVEALAGPNALDVVYDGVGGETFARGLDLLRPRGTMVTFGNASGPVEPVAPLTLSTKGSLYLTRPTLAHYIATPGELRDRATDVLGRVGAGTLTIRIGGRLPLEGAADAHRLLEGRSTSGKLLLVP